MLFLYYSALHKPSSLPTSPFHLPYGDHSIRTCSPCRTRLRTDYSQDIIVSCTTRRKPFPLIACFKASLPIDSYLHFHHFTTRCLRELWALSTVLTYSVFVQKPVYFSIICTTGVWIVIPLIRKAHMEVPFSIQSVPRCISSISAGYGSHSQKANTPPVELWVAVCVA